MSEREVVTRFAPSPTGQLHLGGARTALFSWLHARSRNGRFLVRLEDTDAARSDTAYEKDILEAMKWLGLDWDGEPVHQSARVEIYEQMADVLQQKGLAYWCDCSRERLQKLQEKSRQNPDVLPYDGRCRKRGLKEAPGRALRLLVSDEIAASSSQSIRDLVLGDAGAVNLRVEDFVLRRSDRTGAGGFGYQFCCVADDHDMGITHMIRGVDHWPSVMRQLLLYRSMGWTPPLWAHLPLVLATDGGRLSKRRGAKPIAELRQQGYLPEAVVNFLARLGWSFGDEEFFPGLQWLKEHFDLKRVSRSPATSDLTRLAGLNVQHARHLSDRELHDRYLAWAEEQGRAQPESLATGPELTRALAERCGSFFEIAQALQQLADAPKDYGGLSAAAAFSGEQVQVLGRVFDALNDLPQTEWVAESLSGTIRSLVKELRVSFAAVGMPLRLALTGKKSSVSVDLLCSSLGKTEVLHRLGLILPART